MRDTWFWNTHNEGSVKSLDKLVDMYDASVGHGAVLLLNNTPDPTGLIPALDARRSKAFGDEIKRRYGAPFTTSAGHGPLVTAQPSAPVTIGAIETMEDISQGERVREYAIDGLVDGKWTELARGTAIGHKKIDRIEPVRVSEVRLRVLKSVGEPLIRRLAIFAP